MLLLYAVLHLTISIQGVVQLANDHLLLRFTDEFGLMSVGRPSGEGFVTDTVNDWWQADLVAPKSDNALLKISAASGASLSHHLDGLPSSPKQTLTLTWTDIELAAGNCTVAVNVTLAKDSNLANIFLSFSTKSSLALWDWKVGVGQILLSEDRLVLENKGFGFLHEASSISDFSHAYPQATYQFLSVYGPTLGLYLGTHDPHAHSKTFGLSTSGSPKMGSLFVSATVADAGHASDYVSPFPVTLGVFEGDWWDAAAIYKAWALPNADWTVKGPVSTREDVPAWLYNLTTWVNSHWQGNDIFNITGGDPQVVLERVSNIANLLQLKGGLGLHWYEWDLLGYEAGSGYSNCTSEITCGFDTHYPEYFPVREGFGDVVAALQKLGVRVAPYINGRIFDQGTATWAKPEASNAAAKNTAPAYQPTDLELYDEQYGSKAQFAVMCPHTSYWQGTISDVVQRLAKDYNVDGVYIDQIAAAGPRPCWDPSHSHAVGGGDHWTTGYREMLQQCRAGAGNERVLLTESNAEAFMDGVNIFLTLVGFYGDFVGPSRVVPVFPAIYGGYYFAMGAEFFQADFVKPDLFSAKVARQFLFGAQLGWFSLGGRDNEPSPMGIYDFLIADEYRSELEYLRLLAGAKSVSNRWLLHGSRTRDLPLLVNGSMTQQPLYGAPTPRRSHASAAIPHGHDHAPHDHFDETVQLVFPAVQGSSWLDAESSSIGVFLTTVTREQPARVSFEMDAGRYGLLGGGNVNVTQMFVDSKDVFIGAYPSDSIQVDTVMLPHGVAMFRIEPAM